MYILFDMNSIVSSNDVKKKITYPRYNSYTRITTSSLDHAATLRFYCMYLDRIHCVTRILVVLRRNTLSLPSSDSTFSKMVSIQFSDDGNCFGFLILEHNAFTWSSNGVLAATVLPSLFIVSTPPPPAGRMKDADKIESICSSFKFEIYKRTYSIGI